MGANKPTEAKVTYADPNTRPYILDPALRILPPQEREENDELESSVAAIAASAMTLLCGKKPTSSSTGGTAMKSGIASASPSHCILWVSTMYRFATRPMPKCGLLRIRRGGGI